MQSTAAELESLMEQHVDHLKNIPEDIMFLKPNPFKWSKKEIMGHLVDSAENNIRRFVVAQYEDNPFIIYNQDKWNTINGYQQWNSEALITLWYLLNKQLCGIMKNMPPGVKYRLCQTEQVQTLEWLGVDYIKHLKHHIHQVLELEPVIYP